MGLDDVRPFNFRQRTRIPIFGSEDTLDAIRRTFHYIFDGENAQSTIPQAGIHTSGRNAVRPVRPANSRPIRLLHGRGTVYGFRFGAAAYLTDHSEIPEESMAQLRGLDVLFLDALRHKPHPTHSTVERSIANAEELKPRRTFFTHICHELPHAKTESALPPHIRLAYDGLEINVESGSRCRRRSAIFRSLEEARPGSGRPR